MSKKRTKKLSLIHSSVSVYDGPPVSIMYVVVGGHDYEGLSEPIGIYSSLRQALEGLNKNEDKYDYKKILKYVENNSSGPLEEISD